MIFSQGPGFWASVTQGLAVSAQVEDRLRELGVIVGDRWAFELELERDEEKSAQRLWPPMRQLYLYEMDDRIVAEESDCRNFGSIVLSSKIMNHHMPTSYDGKSSHVPCVVSLFLLLHIVVILFVCLFFFFLTRTVALIRLIKQLKVEEMELQHDETPKKVVMQEDAENEPLLKEKDESV